MAVSRHSIRRALLARLMGPLLLIMLAGGACAYGLAQYFSQAVLDQWLYDSAISLANRVKWQDGNAVVDLPEGAREIRRRIPRAPALQVVMGPTAPRYVGR